jgi:DNA polymerase-3 subunit delta'
VRLETPLGHLATIEGLWSAARADRLAHALCFVGPSGIGKFLAAEWLALGLLCERGPMRDHAARAPCGTCGACKRARADSHPDVFVLDLERENAEKPQGELEEQIRVHRIARRSEEGPPALADFLALRAAEGGWRIALVREADRANEEAQNALLKTLEEPGERTLFVLETARADMLLPTIQSRCVRVRLHAPPLARTIELLAARGIERSAAETLARWCGGAPGQALALDARGIRLVRPWLERLLLGETDAFSAVRGLMELEGDFRARTAAASQRLRARTILDLLLAILRDRERAALGIPLESLAHGDLVGRIRAASASRRRPPLEQCLRARQDVDLNLNPEAALERALSAVDPTLAPADARGETLAPARAGDATLARTGIPW